MAAFSIVEHLNVLEQIGTCFVSGAVAYAVHAFAFENAKEAFYDGVIIAIPGGTHAACDTMPGKLFSEIVTGVLGAAIGVMNEMSAWLARLNGHAQGANHQMPAHPLAH